MRKIILPLIASLAFATPALADGGNARVEVRGGATWSGGQTQDTWGAAAGYDFNLAPMTFAGVEVSGDKVGTSGSIVAYGLTGRLGLKAATGTRVFAAGGYTTKACDLCDGEWHAGAGLEQNIAPMLYVKGEYRHYFENNGTLGGDALVAGVGLRF